MLIFDTKHLVKWLQDVRQHKKRLHEWDSNDKNTYILRSFALLILCGVLAICQYCLNSRLAFYQRTSPQLNLALQESEYKQQLLQNLQASQPVLNDKRNALLLLQSQRQYSGQLLWELANLLPENIILTKVVLRNGKVILDGRAKSDAAVNELMHAIGLSIFFEQPTLISIRQHSESLDGEEFTLSIGCVLPKVDELV